MPAGFEKGAKQIALSIAHLERFIQILERSLALLEPAVPGSIDYEIYCNAVVKGFELTLETAGKLLRRALKLYTASPRSVDELTFKELLRESGRHGLLSVEAVQRWMLYRDNRNTTAHDYGIGFAEATLRLLPGFLTDASELAATLTEKLGDA